MVMETTKAAD